MNKNIIFVWTTKPSNLTPTDSWGFWGIGDIIRGIIGTYQIAKKLNYNFYIDIQNHPISKFLEPHYHPFFNDVKDNLIFLLLSINTIAYSNLFFLFFLQFEYCHFSDIIINLLQK